MEQITERLNGDLPVQSAAAASEIVPDEGTVPMAGLGAGPKDVPHELAESGRDLSLTVPSTVDAGLVADAELVEADAFELRYPFAVWPWLRAAINADDVRFLDAHLSDVADDVEQGYFGDPDVAIVEAAAVGEDWMLPSVTIGPIPTFLETADRIIIEVNDAVPLEFQELHDVYRPGLPPRDPIPLTEVDEYIGEPVIRFDPDKLAAVVRTDQLAEPYPFRELRDDETAIVDHVTAFISDEIRRNPALEEEVKFEVGIGTVGDEIMRRLDDIDTAGRDLSYYGEVVQDGMLDLIDDDVLEAASATGFVLSDEGQDRLHARAAHYAEDVTIRPMSVSNNHGIIDRMGIIAINNVLEIDLYGHANSTHIDGSELVQGIGGSGDYARNGLVSIMVLPSVTTDGERSRVVPLTPHVDHPEHDIDVVVTDQGAADLRGKPPRERAELLIEECAHPDFREQLWDYLDRSQAIGGNIPHELESAFAMHGGA